MGPVFKPVIAGKKLKARELIECILDNNSKRSSPQGRNHVLPGFQFPTSLPAAGKLGIDSELC